MAHQGYYTNSSNLENINDALVQIDADADRAEASAAAALVSESNAAASATSASSSASSASNSANDAATSATNASNSSANAANSATSAANSATAAANSATNAANSATAAANSAASIVPSNFALKAGDTFTGNVNVPSLNGGQLAGFRNRLINGNFQINQRAYVSGTSTGAANQYTLDRWRVVTSGQNLTFTASGNGNQVTAPAGGVEQVIEGINIEGGTYVLNWTGTATATVNGTARAKGETFTLTANTNTTVRFIGGTASLVQLEPGYVATPFEHRSIGTERALCQRYFWRIANLGVGVASMGGDGFGLSFPVTMRASPTISNASFGVGGGAAGTPTLFYSNSEGLLIYNIDANWSVGAAVNLSADLSSEL